MMLLIRAFEWHYFSCKYCLRLEDAAWHSRLHPCQQWQDSWSCAFGSLFVKNKEEEPTTLALLKRAKKLSCEQLVGPQDQMPSVKYSLQLCSLHGQSREVMYCRMATRKHLDLSPPVANQYSPRSASNSQFPPQPITIKRWQPKNCPTASLQTGMSEDMTSYWSRGH